MTADQPHRQEAEPSSPELDAAIAARPDDPSVWKVYADWLEERGDPRAELMRLSPDDPRAKELIARNWQRWFGDFPKEQIRDTWRDGFVIRARLLRGPTPAEWTPTLLRRSMRFVRALDFGATPLWAPEVEALFSLPLLERVRLVLEDGMGVQWLAGHERRFARLGARLQLCGDDVLWVNYRTMLRALLPEARLTPLQGGVEPEASAVPRFAPLDFASIGRGDRKAFAAKTWASAGEPPLPLLEGKLRRCARCASDKVQVIWSAEREKGVAARDQFDVFWREDEVEYRCDECGSFTHWSLDREVYV